jgi:hypothetical protein
MTFENPKRLIGAIAIATMLGSASVALADTASLQMQLEIEETAVLDVSIDSGEVEVVGEDIDHVSIRALITVDERLSSSDPIKAGSIIGAIKRSPPIEANGDRIVITSLKKRTHQRHVSMTYEILVPRNAKVSVHSDAGNVTVSGVTGPVQATSDSGKVIVAELDVTGSMTSGD